MKVRAQLQHTEPAVREMAGATKTAAQRLRVALASARLASGMAAVAAGIQRGTGAQQQQQRNLQGGSEVAPGSMWGSAGSATV